MNKYSKTFLIGWKAPALTLLKSSAVLYAALLVGEADVSEAQDALNEEVANRATKNDQSSVAAEKVPNELIEVAGEMVPRDDYEARKRIATEELLRDEEMLYLRTPLLFASPEYYLKRNWSMLTSKDRYLEGKAWTVGDQVLMFNRDIPDERIKSLQSRIDALNKEVSRLCQSVGSAFSSPTWSGESSVSPEIKKEVADLQKEIRTLVLEQFNRSETESVEKKDEKLVAAVRDGQYMATLERMLKVLREQDEILELMQLDSEISIARQRSLNKAP